MLVKVVQRTVIHMQYMHMCASDHFHNTMFTACGVMLQNWVDLHYILAMEKEWEGMSLILLMTLFTISGSSPSNNTWIAATS